MNFSKSLAVESTEQGEDGDRKDFSHYLLNARDPETGLGFSTPELWAEINLFIIAGSDTPATAMAGCFYYLAHNARVLRTLEEEVCSTFDKEEEIDNYSSNKLADCPHLRAVIDEAMRMSPSVTGTVPREVLKGGIMIDGEYIPAGTTVGTGCYSLHHNPQYFHEPFSYKPERWTVGSSPEVTAESVELAQSGFFPFSFGPRGCIDKNPAYVELRSVIARTVWLYETRLAPGSMVGNVEAGGEDCRRQDFGMSHIQARMPWSLYVR